MMNWITTVRGRLVLMIGAILATGFLTTNVISFQVSTASLKAAILQNELPLTSSNIYSEIQGDILGPLYVASTMSNDTFLKDWITEGETDPDAIERYLLEIRDKYRVFTSFFISNKTLNYYHFSKMSRRINPDDPGDAWFFRARDMTTPYEINIDFNKEQGDAVTVFINYRVLDARGQFLGVTGVGLALPSMTGILDRYRDGGRRSLYMVDGKGRVTAHTLEALLGADDIRTAPGISTVANAIMSQDAGYFEYAVGGETMLLSSRLIPNLGWRVLVVQRESDAIRAIRDSFITNLVIGLFIVVLTVGTIGWAVNVYQKRLEDMAVHDRLTGLGNRQMFDIVLDQTLAQYRRSGPPFSLLMIDIDDFKAINDRYGHLRGDAVIRHVSQAIAGRVRRSDVVCRWGGEELVVLARDCRLEAATNLAEELRRAAAASVHAAEGGAFSVTVSIGVAEAALKDDAVAVVARADHALYRAKEQGRNKVVAAARADSGPAA